MIIFRYLTRELAASLAAITGLLLLIFLSNQFVRFLSRAAAGKFSGGLVFKLIALETPHLLGILLPLGLFLSILFVYGRLYAENEMTVLHACGFSQNQLTLWTLPITLIVFVITSLLAFWISPTLINHRDKLLTQTGTAIELETVLPGRFQETPGGQKIFYVENMSPDHQTMQNVFMAEAVKSTDNGHGTTWAIMTAEKGYQMLDPKTRDRFFVASQGRRYQGTPGYKDFRMTEFKQYGIRIQSEVADIINQYDAMPTLTLLKMKKDPNLVDSELQWRASIPISALLLMALALPLCRVNPRQGRYSRLVPAILIYIIYSNLLLIGRSWIESGHLSPALGLWAIHGGLLLIILGLWWREFGR